MQVRPIAFYLPQYHPIPENDAWWGKGFTEWTNVTKAKPLYSSHYQPHLPSDLGFYDLRLSETRQAQADLAKEYGIYGFCYYHYWFNGRRLLERPFDEVLNSEQPDFPFCLCWANENWTRRWDGKEQNLLLQQVYSEEDDRLHMQWLAKAFFDRRYIRVEGKPLFLVYRATKIPNLKQTVKIWREEARRLGVGEIFLCRVESFAGEQGDPNSIGFDAAVEFQPDWSQLGLPLQKGKLWHLARKLRLARQAFENHNIYEYSTVVKHMLAKSNPTYERFPCVTPSWDNTARRKIGAIVFQNSTPQIYEYWLKTIVDRTLTSRYPTEKIIFINAWNEWAEGNHLEPCQKWGRAYLEATRKAVKEDKAEFKTYSLRKNA